jgi:hypothetical protein
MTDSDQSAELTGQLNDLIHRWLTLAAQARQRSADKPKGELFALYDKASAEAYELAANDLTELLNEMPASSPINDLLAQLYGMAARWDAMAADARQRAATTSLGGAHHFGTASSLAGAVNDIRGVAASKQQR